MNQHYFHRYNKNISCVLLEIVEIGCWVLETSFVHGRKLVRRKFFNNMDFDPQVGCWIPDTVNR